jgi:hypothetical protein
VPEATPVDWSTVDAGARTDFGRAAPVHIASVDDFKARTDAGILAVRSDDDAPTEVDQALAAYHALSPSRRDDDALRLLVDLQHKIKAWHDRLLNDELHMGKTDPFNAKEKARRRPGMHVLYGQVTREIERLSQLRRA